MIRMSVSATTNMMCSHHVERRLDEYIYHPSSSCGSMWMLWKIYPIHPIVFTLWLIGSLLFHSCLWRLFIWRVLFQESSCCYLVDIQGWIINIRKQTIQTFCLPFNIRKGSGITQGLHGCCFDVVIFYHRGIICCSKKNLSHCYHNVTMNHKTITTLCYSIPPIVTKG